MASDRRYHIRLSGAENEALREVAARTELTINEAVRRAILLFVAADRAKAEGKVVGAASRLSDLDVQFVTVI